MRMNVEPDYHIHISSKTDGFRLNLREVWHYRDLIWLLTRKTFKLSYKQTVLGPAWIVISPLLSSLAYMFIFGFIAGIGTDGIPQMLFYLLGTAVWGLFSFSLTSSSSTFLANAYVFGKVYFPRLTVPISNLLVGLIKFGIQMIVVVILMAVYTAQGVIHPQWWMFIILPFTLAHLCLMGMGIGIILSSLTTKYRDLQVLVSFGVSLLMYATPVVYPISQLGEGTMRTIILANPVTSPVEMMRCILTGAGTIDPTSMAISIIFTIVVVVVGIFMFNRVEKTFIDTI